MNPGGERRSGENGDIVGYKEAPLTHLRKTMPDDLQRRNFSDVLPRRAICAPAPDVKPMAVPVGLRSAAQGSAFAPGDGDASDRHGTGKRLHGAHPPAAELEAARETGYGPAEQPAKSESTTIEAAGLPMQNISIQRAGDLPQTVRSAVEQLLGRRIAPDEEISVAALPPQQISPSEGRSGVARRLEAFLDRRARKVGDVPDAEIDAAIDEAVKQARHSRG